MGIHVRLKPCRSSLSWPPDCGNHQQASLRVGVLRRGVDRLSVGVGMIPPGEVGLIFASIGKV
jgi:hypothetical protein